jgi:hypothetical protein
MTELLAIGTAMTKTDRSRKSDQFAAADAAIERAVTTFVSKFERMCGKWEAVASADFIIERTLLVLCEKLAKVIGARLSVHPAEVA